MKYFAVFLKPADKEVAKRLKDEHIAYVKTCCKEGKIHLVGKLVDAGGLIVFRTETKEEVEAYVAGDPFVRHGARTYEIYEWDMKTADEYLA